MPTCPKGHESADTDYCDECGTPIGARSTPAPSGNGSSPAPAAAPSGAAGAGEPCPNCSTPRSDRFCEVCGYDFVAAQLSAAAGVPAAGGNALGGNALGGNAPGGAAAGGTAGASPQGAPAGTSTGDPAGSGDAGGGGNPAGGGDAGTGASGAGPAAATPDGTATPSPDGPLPTRQPTVTPTWRAAVAADAEYHARMQAIADPGVEPIAFPTFCPERRFWLRGPQMLIGRLSRSRGIEPDIDLTGPPTDPAVSHAHAMLVVQPDGSWALVDLGSSNGTYLNDGAEAIKENVPVPLSDGDRIHLGAFSTITVRRA
ncbi:FHA domain-containing protein [Rugosimonospora africana]|uniref:FHA domain-containing protein n=1 Tax=Rugosimonospora africana TaxID=556532 RepID=A0A8J3VMQ6_9ACTN|nr:FHA domain-containing protein [Rugosimonospora africana]GIH11952.1 hypothetical protein Raf01_01240 [Rugosimonospora africana]